MRLIDADMLVKIIKQEPTDGMFTEEIIQAINEQPIAYDVFGVLNQLDEIKSNASEHITLDKSWLDYMNRGSMNALDMAIEVVKRGGQKA